MNRIKLKYGGKCRRKALFGVDGAITAAATLAAAAMNVAATNSAAKQQAEAIKNSADINSKALLEQNENNTELQKEKINFERQQNEENRNATRDIQLALQMQAGQENNTYRRQAQRQALKRGGRKQSSSPVRESDAASLMVTFPYGGARQPSFEVIDGGYVQPIQVYPDGVLYEIKGNDHEHYHKTIGGKSKSGVGIRTRSGEVIEGEGNQNTNRGELLFDDGTNLNFISKHSIKGINPRQLVEQGVHPKEALAIQEIQKGINNLDDEGNIAKCGRRFKLKCGGKRPKAEDGLSLYLMQDLDPLASYQKANYVNRFGNNSSTTSTTTSLGGGSSFWNNYGGATMNAGANLLGSALSWIGGSIAQNRLANARNEAAGILADAYSRMQTIDDSFINREDYEAPHTLAVIRAADTNINPQLERLRRNASAETRLVNNGTLSSAARQQRLAGINDRMQQRTSEQYAYKHNADEQIKQQNAQAITQTAQENANRDVQARRDYTNARLSLKQYNNNIENQKIAGIAQAQADAITGNATDYSTMMNSGMTGLASSIASAGQAFGSAYDANRVYNQNVDLALFGADTSSRVDYAVQQAMKGNKTLASQYLAQFENSSNPIAQTYAERLRKVLS